MEQEVPFGAKIKFLSVKIDQKMNEKCRDWELTGSQAQVLHYLYKCEQKGRQVNIRAMSEWLHQSHVTVLGVIDRMEQKGFVTTQTDPEDKRCRRVALTEKAYQAKAQIGRYHHYLDDTLLRGFSPQEQAVLADMMDRLLQNACAL